MNHMILHRFSHYTIKNYMSAVEKLAKYHNKSPDKLTNEDIQNYLLYLIGERKLAWGTCNVHIAGISCFYKNILQWDETDFQLPPSPKIKKLPNILSVEEAKRLFECAANLKHRVLLKTLYSAGLRISEAVKLKPMHIESDPSRMMIRIEQGKGKKDRYTSRVGAHDGTGDGQVLPDKGGDRVLCFIHLKGLFIAGAVFKGHHIGHASLDNFDHLVRPQTDGHAGQKRSFVH